MNKEQIKFKKVIKARKLRQKTRRSRMDKFGSKLPVSLWSYVKSKKFKIKLK